jgi:hypothetical protein
MMQELFCKVPILFLRPFFSPPANTIKPTTWHGNGLWYKCGIRPYTFEGPKQGNNNLN